MELPSSKQSLFLGWLLVYDIKIKVTFSASQSRWDFNSKFSWPSFTEIAQDYKLCWVEKREKTMRSYFTSNTRLGFFHIWLTVFIPSSQGKDFLYRMEHDSIFMEISTNRYLLPFCIVLKVFEDVIFECQIFFVSSKSFICNKNQKKYSLFKLKVVEHEHFSELFCILLTSVYNFLKEYGYIFFEPLGSVVIYSMQFQRQIQKN